MPESTKQTLEDGAVGLISLSHICNLCLDEGPLPRVKEDERTRFSLSFLRGGLGEADPQAGPAGPSEIMPEARLDTARWPGPPWVPSVLR